MRKRYHNFSHQDGIGFKLSEKSKPTKPVKIKDLRTKNTTGKKKRTLKFVFAAIVLILVGIVGFEGFAALKATNNILPGGISLKDLVTTSALKESDGRTNILLLGKGGANHAGGQLTDTIQILSIENKDKKFALISIPRDLQVTIPGHGIAKINEAYADGYNDEKSDSAKDQSGYALAAKVISTVTGVPIQYHVTADFVGFKDLVDSLGGVSVNVDKNLYDPFYPKDVISSNSFTESDAYTTVNIKAGVQNMNGITALEYARSRETTSDFDRSKRQQTIMVAVKDKALSLGVLANPVKVTDMLGALGNHIKTDLTLPEIKDLAGLIKGLDTSTIINKVIDNSPGGLLVSTDQGGYYLLPKAGNFSEVQAAVKGIFDTSSTAVVPEVDISNGSNIAGVGSKLSDQLKTLGITATKIETSATLSSVTTIYDGSSNSATLAQIKTLLPNATVSINPTKGVIEILIGKDYGK